jgi:hypothetical protein
MKTPSVCAVLIAAAVAFVLVFGNLSISMMLVSAGAAAIVYSITSSIQYATGSAIAALFTMAGLMRSGVIRKEGFNVFTGPTDISKMVRKIVKEGFKSKDDEEEFKNKDDEEEGFRAKDDEEEFKNKDDDEEGFRAKDDEEEFKNKDDEEEGFTNMNSFKSLNEGFMSQVFQNITKAGYNSPGFGMAGPLVEGFEDEKKADKKGRPAPAIKKEQMAMPFKLGEIPSQVKNGPHIDAGATLIKAIQGLNPDQINAMTKDTKQLIETQKSLMGMLGTMKPMMNDGKELMETFQQMFGEDAKVM